jgi:hypothetical protein
MEGVVRTSDQKAVDAILKARRPAKTDADECEEGAGEPAEPAWSLPKAVARDLTTVRTRAIRATLAADPDIALAVCVGALAYRALRRSDMIGIGIAAHARDIDDLAELGEVRASLDDQLPDNDLEALDWALGLSRDGLLSVLAVLVASSLDLAHEGASTADLRVQAMGDRLARHLDVDMTRFWKADIDYWVRLPKAALLDALVEASDAPVGTTDLLKAHTKLRKEELAGKLAALHANTGYLPSILVTPIGVGGVELTDAGEAALQTPAVAAE